MCGSRRDAAADLADALFQVLALSAEASNSDILVSESQFGFDGLLASAVFDPFFAFAGGCTKHSGCHTVRQW